jgi:hypothetical protein
VQEQEQGQKLDSERLRAMSTADLFRHALEETRLLARAEVLHARQEVRDELRSVKTAGIALGATAVLALCGIALMLVAAALAIPLQEPISALIVGGACLLAALGGGLFALRKVPKKLLKETQGRVRQDVAMVREELQ